MNCKPLDTRLREFALKEVISQYVFFENSPNSKILDKFRTTNRFCVNDGEEQIKWVLENSDHKLRMYGSPRELAENLKIYRNFPVNSIKFQLGFVQPYNNNPILFSSLKGEEFILKQDLFIFIQELLFIKLKGLTSLDKIPSLMVAIILKSYEERLDSCCEFVRYDSEVERMQNEVGRLADEIKTNIQKKIQTKNPIPAKLTKFEDLFKYYKKLVPKWKDEASLQMHLVFRHFYEKDNNGKNFKDSYFLSEMIANVIGETVDSFPDLFSPSSMSRGLKTVATARVFIDNGHQFVMKYEVLKAFNYPGIEKLTNYEKTISLEDAKSELGEHLDLVEFIQYPIKRAKHAAVPILRPTGGHCILAADALIQFLRSLIFEYKVFQKCDKDYFHIIQHCFQDTPFLACNKFKHFISMETFDKFRTSKTSSLMEVMEVLPKSTAKDVRNAKKDGFTMQNLKNELIHLGVTELFPEILDYAEKVYITVSALKKEKFLRTCDLFDAVENCMMICIFNRFSNLKIFLHNQDACYRIAHLECDLCSLDPPETTTFKCTNGSEYQEKDASLRSLRLPGNSDLHSKIVFKNGNEFITNLSYFSSEEVKKHNIKIMILDKLDTEFIKKELKIRDASKKKNKEKLFNIDNFTKVFPKKKIYLRTFFVHNNIIVKTSVFVDEAFDTIEFLLKQAGNYQKMEARLEKYRKKWRNEEEDFYKTVDSTVFWYFLESFDIDKTLVTLVPDPYYSLSRTRMYEDEGDPTMDIISPDGKVVISNQQALFHIFQSIYCEINWGVGLCCEGQHLADNLKKLVLGAMQKHSEMEEGLYVVKSSVDAIIELFRDNCYFRSNHKTTTSLGKLERWEQNDIVPIEFIRSECPSIYYYFTISEMKYYQMWRVRNLLLLDLALKMECSQNLINACTSEIEYKYADANLFNHDLEILTSEEFQTGEMKKPEPKLPKKLEKLIMEKKLAESVKEKKEAKPKIDPPKPVEIPVTKVVEPKEGESKCCSKCLRTSEKCNEAVKEMKMAQNKLEKYEKKAKKSMELEKRMKEMEKEMKKMKIEKTREESNSEKIKIENEELKAKVSQVDTIETKLNMSERNLTDTRNNLMDEIADLKVEVELQKEHFVIQEQEKIQIHCQKELELAEKRHEIERLIEFNAQLLSLNEEYKREIRHLYFQISMVPIHQTPPPTPTESLVTVVEEPRTIRYQKLSLEKIKDSFRHGYQLKTVKTMVERLISLSPESEVDAKYELYQFEGKVMNYLQEVERNIQKIKETGDPKDVDPLPQPPQLSDRFMELYWNHIDKGKRSFGNPPPIQQPIVSDSECLICFDEMIEEHKTLKCGECKKVLHHQCASKWLSVHRSCPNCRRELLDPNEFPNLS